MSDRPQNNLECFRDKVWNNPISNDATKEHRTNMIEQFNLFLDKATVEFGIDREKIVAFPTGSVLWNIEPKEDGRPDFDFVVVCKDEDTQNKMLDARAELYHGGNDLKLDLFMFDSYESIKLNENSLETEQPTVPFYLPFVLITPDAMVAGNKDFAHTIQKDFREVVSTLDEVKKQKLWELMNEKFRAMWVFWHRRKDQFNGSGTSRLNKYIDEKTSKYDPVSRERYRQKFMELLEKINLPAIDELIKV